MGIDQDRIDTGLYAKGPKCVTFTNTDTTYQMKVADHNLRVVSGTGEDATGIVTLPPCGEAAGMFYFIIAPTGASGNDVSIYVKETATEYAGFNTDDGDLDADGDYILLFSTGFEWKTVFNGVA